MASDNPPSIVVRLVPALRNAIEAGVAIGLGNAATDGDGIEAEAVGSVAGHLNGEVLERVLAVLGLDWQP